MSFGSQQAVERGAGASAEPPAGSLITIEHSGPHPKIVLPFRKSWKRFFHMGLLVFGTTGLLFSIGLVGSIFLDSLEQGIRFEVIFTLVFMLVIGGGGLFTFGRRTFQKPLSAQLVISRPSLSYDTGRWPLTAAIEAAQQGRETSQMKILFPKRTVIELSPEAMQTLALREHQLGNRLTVDHGGERIELAKHLSELEREWLYAYLKSYYP